MVDLDERAMAGPGFNVIIHFSAYRLCNGSSAPSATPIPIVHFLAYCAAMPKRKETDKVTFIAEYRDGSVARFDIDPWTLRNGHWVARIIARERQEQGSLKPGEIVRVYPERRR